MISGRAKSEWRAAVFAVALFAVSINFLQPLAHAALIRHGGPVATLLWKAMCAAEAPDDRSLPQQHQTTKCCLGLACAVALPALATAFLLVQYARDVDRPPVVALDALAPVGIRDGPAQPHGPPPTA
ncbi:hypothetical protein [Reyranella sp.]|uniref:hypothetical protein n=1 Tax=Reyranella sp. TaxID=1929291 RepID=UPI003D09F6DD